MDVKHTLSSHQSACCSVVIEFIPLVAETLGGLAEDTLFTIGTLGQGAASPDPSISGTSSIVFLLPFGVAMPVCCKTISRRKTSCFIFVVAKVLISILVWKFYEFTLTIGLQCNLSSNIPS